MIPDTLFTPRAPLRHDARFMLHDSWCKGVYTQALSQLGSFRKWVPLSPTSRTRQFNAWCRGAEDLPHPRVLSKLLCRYSIRYPYTGIVRTIMYQMHRLHISPHTAVSRPHNWYIYHMISYTYRLCDTCHACHPWYGTKSPQSVALPPQKVSKSNRPQQRSSIRGKEVLRGN